VYSWRTPEIRREKRSDVGRKRPREEEGVHIGLAAWDRCPSALQPIPRLHSVFICLLLQSSDKEKMLMHLFIHWLISVFQ